MNRLFAGGLVVGLAGATTLGVAGVSWAQSAEDLTFLSAHIDVQDFAPGDTVEVSSEDPCSFFEDGPSTGTIEFALFRNESEDELSWQKVLDGEVGPVFSDSAELNEDGSWSVSFEAPGVDEQNGDTAWIPEDAVVDEVYGGYGVTVVDDEAEAEAHFVFKAICQPDLPEDEEPTTTLPDDGTTPPPPATPIEEPPPTTG
jgi:hypothetical protein